MVPLSFRFAVLALAGAAHAAPAPVAACVPPTSNSTAPPTSDNTVTQGNVTPLSTNEIDAWKEPMHFASAIYCGPQQVMQWKCGPDCDALSNVKVAVHGGDNSETPWWYVANDGKRVIVSVAGANLSDPTTQANLVNFKLRDVDAKYLPDAAGVAVHSGFYDLFKLVVDDIARGVDMLGPSAPKDILIVGHSLGAAIAELLAVSFTSRYPDHTITARLFAPPRVGNPAWADHVDHTLGDRLRHVSIHFDVVTHLPKLDMGYRHPSGEVFIDQADSPNWVSCEGQENDKCQAQYEKDVPPIEELLTTLPSLLKEQAHSGPYFGQILGGQCLATGGTNVTTTSAADPGPTNPTPQE